MVKKQKKTKELLIYSHLSIKTEHFRLLNLNTQEKNNIINYQTMVFQKAIYYIDRIVILYNLNYKSKIHYAKLN